MNLKDLRSAMKQKYQSIVSKATKEAIPVVEREAKKYFSESKTDFFHTALSVLKIVGILSIFASAQTPVPVSSPTTINITIENLYLMESEDFVRKA